MIGVGTSLEDPALTNSPFPLPTTSHPSQSGSLTPINDLMVVLGDDKAIATLIDKLLDRANLSDAELASRLGVKKATIYQYRVGRRKKPSIQWLLRLINACGGKLLIEYPTGPLMR